MSGIVFRNQRSVVVERFNLLLCNLPTRRQKTAARLRALICPIETIVTVMRTPKPIRFCKKKNQNQTTYRAYGSRVPGEFAL